MSRRPPPRVSPHASAGMISSWIQPELRGDVGNRVPRQQQRGLEREQEAEARSEA